MLAKTKTKDAIASRTIRKSLFALDSRFTVQWKLLFDAMPEDYANLGGQNGAIHASREV